MKRLSATLFICSIFCQVAVFAQNKIIIPDTDKHLILTGDMHMHTIFSDGNVWPTTRVEEAHSEGVEVICMTDHLDHRHKRLANQGIFNGDRNYSYDVAAKLGKKLDVIVIKGAEISRGMPPGHFNTIFISDVEPIAQASDAHKDNQKGMLAGLEKAKEQNAFCTWNHPHWYAHNPLVKWHPEHEEIYKKGLMQGIEVFNSCDGFSFEAFQWALDKNLTLICGTDVHTPMFREYNFPAGELRPVTLIFANEKSEAGVQEALLNRRTAVFANSCVYGREEQLTELLSSILTIELKENKYGVSAFLKNNSSIPLRMKRVESSNPEVLYSRFQVIYPFESQEYICRGPVYKAPLEFKEFVLTFEVENFYTAPGQNLVYSITIKR
jgi:hypothetical protein